MSICSMPSGARGINDGIIHSRRAGDGARFAHALDTDRVVRRGRHRMPQLEHWEHIGARHRIIQQRAGQQLPLLIVDAPFAECLPDSLHDAAMDLPG